MLNQHTDPLIKLLTLFAILVSAIWAYCSWNEEVDKRKTDITLKFFEKLMEKDYISKLWEIHEFTICFEKSFQFHISYIPFSQVKNSTPARNLARQWWAIVEKTREAQLPKDCGEPKLAEEKLMLVFGRLEALASCSRQRLCSYRKVVNMIEAFDYVTVLSISNYLLFAHQGDISREWTTYGAFSDLIELIEKYVFEGRVSANKIAKSLDTNEPTYWDRPILTAPQIQEIWKKPTRCDRVEADESWKNCLPAKHQP